MAAVNAAALMLVGLPAAVALAIMLDATHPLGHWFEPLGNLPIWIKPASVACGASAAWTLSLRIQRVALDGD